MPATFVAMSPSAHAQAAVIRDIRVEGNRRMEAETIRTYLRLNVGDRYDAGRADDSIRSLFSTGLFSDVRITPNGSTLVVSVVENPIIAQVAFEGNSEVDKATLEAEVQLKPRAVFTRAKAQADVQRILDVYRRQGRFAAQVSPKLIELDNNRVNVVFEITEGQATKVKSIAFVGNRAFSDSQLRDIVTTTQSGWFDFLKGTNVYDPDRLNLDKELLRQYYQKNGYADARIVSAGAELDRDGSGFFITFVIEEGELYNFGTVSIESKLPQLDTAPLQKEILTYQGKLFNLQQIDKTAEALTIRVNELGYAFGRVRPRTDRDPAVRAINIVYVVEEGPRVYIERININGNQRTHDYVIRREFRVAEGDAYNPLLVENAKKRIQNLGFFKAVDIRRRPGSAQDRVVLDVELQEQSTGELSFGAGYSSSEGVIGDISITERNLLGRGQFLRFGVQASKSSQNYNIAFTEPRFLGTNIAAGFDIFRKQQTETDQTPYRSTTTGFGLRANFPITEALWINTGYTFSHNTFAVTNRYISSSATSDSVSTAIKQACGITGAGLAGPIAAPDDTNSEFCKDSYITSMASVGFTLDHRNHPKNPNKGYYVAAGVDFAGLGGDTKFARFNGEVRAYYPLGEKVTLVGRIAAGHIMGLGGEDVRLLDMFYRGGETIRGFNRLGYGPRDIGSINKDALGGTSHWVATAEVRFPLPFLPDELGMSAAVFADAGSLFGTSDEIKAALGANLLDSSEVRSSVGIGILWNSPLGPLRFDYAYALSKNPNDKLQPFRFGASTKF
ncbi:MAG TPA: outer membrane protein assembly factor BamA [Hyphomicrobiaceae bacterium]|mgnify:CR=1 FL=1|nr:outer membrane protein assembly factor BamA [Hyphomicrobiaceae bacterium]